MGSLKDRSQTLAIDLDPDPLIHPKQGNREIP